MPDELELRRAAHGDIPFIMQTERMPGFDDFVGRSDETAHHAMLEDTRFVYFIGEAPAGPVGFCIVRDWASPERCAYIKRIAVRAPGEGHGGALLRAVCDAVFGETDAHRLWLGLFPHNARAQRAYAAAGFMLEGTARGSVWYHGEVRDQLIMSLLRPDWLALTRHSP